MSADPSTVIRLAIAFVALKHKPREQSTASYVLDLQSQFPLFEISDESVPFQPPDGANKWRAHALELEKRLKVLQEQRDVDQEELFRLREDVAQMHAKMPTPSDAPPPKKKAKKNKEQQVSSDPSWSWDSVRADWSKFLHSQYPPAPSLLFTYTTLRGALLSSLSTSASPTSIYEDKEASVCRIADAIIRAVEAVHVFLFLGTWETSISNPSATMTSSSTPLPPSAPSSAQHAPPLSAWSSSRVSHGGRYENLTSSRIAASSPLLMYTLHTAFPTLLHACGELTSLHDKHRDRGTVPLRTDDGRAQGSGLGAHTGHEQVDRVLDVFLELILLPLVRAFRPLCRARLVSLYTPGTTSGAQASASEKVNPPASTSSNAGPSTSAAKQTGAKEASKEKEKGKKGKSKAIQNSKETPTLPADSNPDPARRAATDIRKDTLALFGTTLGVLLTNPTPPSTSTPAHSGSHKSTSGIRDRVALEAIHELEALYGFCHEDDTSLTSGTDRANPSSSGILLPAPALASSQHHPASSTTFTSADTLTDRSVKPQGEDGTPHTDTVGRNAKTSLTAAIKHGREAWRADIFQMLATKDAAWYLCSVLHLAVVSPESRTSAGEEARTSPLLMRAVIEGVGRLLRLAAPDLADIGDGDGLVKRFEMDHRGGGGDKSGSERQQSAGSAAAPVIDPVTQNMLLAICEKAMCGYAEMDPDLVG